MSKKLKLSKRLTWMEEGGYLPFDLDFLRVLGFSFTQDWDCEVLIKAPESISVEDMTRLIKRFEKGLEKRLDHEQRRAMSVCVGGPKNGQECGYGATFCKPLLFHIGRAEWAVYGTKGSDDPRAWYLGAATSAKKARQLWLNMEVETQ